ncbi:DUF1648 domain-containing protein [Streptococcus panodentis]|uniref:DUF1648 domain-containing protein n=1 Tax=Streptococcus panodentis TaxID=1581472 RepID=A0ABS5ATW2_9STRE|nr:DUF1648 domain-containing protein [Streptococcus panodentis]MBP2620012.1 hypothetical protein [Streptococcus panodentis]
MKRKDIFVLVVMAALVVLLIFFLPNQVPVHFNSTGKADIIVNRFWLILSLPIPYSLYWKYFRHK